MKRLLAVALLALGIAGLPIGRLPAQDEPKHDHKPKKRTGEPPLLACAPVVGYAGATAAAIWAAPVSSSASLALELFTSDSKSWQPFPDVTVNGAIVHLEGLAPATSYAYRIMVDDQWDEGTSGTFRTGPEAGKPCKGKIAVASCMHVERFPRQVAWGPLLEERPDLLLHLGDNIYANSVVPEEQRRWFWKQRSVPEYARVLRSCATLAIWDDHDFGANDSDGTLPGKEKSLATFKAIWPNPAGGLEGTPGVFFQQSYGDVDLFLLDTRYHRAPNEAEPEAEKPMLGAAQFAWLERELRASKATFKLVASGSPFVASLKDYWGLYPRDRDRLLRLTNEVPGMVFLSGDIHTALLSKGKRPGAAYPIHEVVSSGIAVNTAELHFFVTLDVDTTVADPTLGVNVFHVDGKGTVTQKKQRTILASELRAPD